MKFLKPIKILLILSILAFPLGTAPQAGAFFLEDWFNVVKNVVSPDAPQEISLDASLQRTLSGDENKNGVIDGGDIVTFKYIIKNPTNKEFSFATLKTNIPRNNLNFIHNIQGSASLSDNNNTITFPNLRINPGQILEVSFDARLNYFTDSDKSIFTEPEIITSDKKSLIKSERHELKVKPWKGKVNSMIESRLKP